MFVFSPKTNFTRLQLALFAGGRSQELSRLGVQHAVDSELTSWIVSRPDLEVAWASSRTRWNVLAERLDWVS
ncbi:hypothetical protein A8E26_05845 [Burkholderia cenocepacia]|nr:hypothetical protein A8E26_05845 [Burkholderia cenocepacia]